MKKYWQLTLRITCLTLVSLLGNTPVLAEPAPKDDTGMSAARLHQAIIELGENVAAANNMIEFEYNNQLLICIFDVNADRMRLISPIAKVTDINSEQLLYAMAANFHTALDARYAISNGMVYSAFIHPLRSLSKNELHSAIHQVSSANSNFGGSYSSGYLYFQGEQSAPQEKSNKKQSAI